MDGLEAQADIWADEVDLVVIIKNIGDASRKLTDRMPKAIREGFINRQEANVDAIVRQAYLEGFYRGGESRREYDEAHREALITALRKVRGYNVDIASGRINYRPEDHIQVIDEALGVVSAKAGT